MPHRFATFLGILIALQFAACRSSRTQKSEKTIRWTTGSGQFFVGSIGFRELTSDGIDVSASVEPKYSDEFWKVYVMVKNVASPALPLDPRGWTLEVTQPKREIVGAMAPEEVERVWTSLHAESPIERWERTTGRKPEIRSTPAGSESVVKDAYGTVVGTMVTERDSHIVTFHPNSSKSSNIVDEGFKAQAVREGNHVVLKPTTLARAGDIALGWVCFKEAEAPSAEPESQLILRISLRGSVFEFPWTVTWRRELFLGKEITMPSVQ